MFNVLVIKNENFGVSAPPNLPIFGNLTAKKIPDLQQCVYIRKSHKSAKSLHPIPQL